MEFWILRKFDLKYLLELLGIVNLNIQKFQQILKIKFSVGKFEYLKQQGMENGDLVLRCLNLSKVCTTNYKFYSNLKNQYQISKNLYLHLKKFLSTLIDMSNSFSLKNPNKTWHKSNKIHNYTSSPYHLTPP